MFSLLLALPPDPVLAAKARAWAILRPELLKYLLSACRNDESWSHANYRDLIPMFATAATAMLTELAQLLPDRDPSDLSLWVIQAILPVVAESFPDEALGTEAAKDPCSAGLWFQWISEAWLVARWQLSGASPCTEFDISPFAVLQPIHQNRIVAALQKSLDDALPALRAELLGQKVRTASAPIFNTAPQPIPGETRDPDHGTLEQPKLAATVDSIRSVGQLNFPKRAAWLQDRLRERAWNKHDVSRQAGPDHKTVQRILDGKRVREDVLQKLAQALSKTHGSKKVLQVSLLDIPHD